MGETGRVKIPGVARGPRLGFVCLTLCGCAVARLGLYKNALKGGSGGQRSPPPPTQRRNARECFAASPSIRERFGARTFLDTSQICWIRLLSLGTLCVYFGGGVSVLPVLDTCIQNPGFRYVRFGAWVGIPGALGGWVSSPARDRIPSGVGAQRRQAPDKTERESREPDPGECRYVHGLRPDQVLPHVQNVPNFSKTGSPIVGFPISSLLE